MSDRLEELVKRLPKQVEPGRDLWPDIRSQLRPRRPAAGMPFFRLAAAVLVGAIAIGTYFALRPGAPTPGNTARTATPAQRVKHAQTVVARNLETVDRTIVDIRDALQHDPDNPVLYGILAEAYRQQNRLMLERSRLSLIRSYTS